MRLDRGDLATSKADNKLLWSGIAVILILLLPSVNSVKTSLIHMGFVATEQTSSGKALQLASELLKAPINILKANTQLPTLKLDVKYQDWLKIEQDRSQALATGQIAEERAEVNASLYFDKKKYGAKIRLQGDMLDHVNGQTRWSLRVELKNKQAIYESRRFALVGSNVRIHQGPTLFAKTLKMAEFDIVSPKTIPVNVIVNGENWGVMLFEQSFSQDLLATNDRTEGLIVRLDTFEQHTDPVKGIIRTVKPRVLQEKTILDNSALGKQRQLALTLLDDFFAGKKSASEVFIADKLGQYLATVDIWGAWHALTWNNWRWYYNPHLAKLEPIQSDVAVTPAEHIWLMQAPSKSLLISKLMLADPEVQREYNLALNHLQSLLTNEHFLHELKAYETLFLKKLQSSAPLVQPYDFNIMLKQAACLSSDYQSAPCDNIPTLSTSLHVNMNEVHAIANWDLLARFNSNATNTANTLTIFNNDNVPLSIKGITGTTRFDEIDPLERVNADFPQVVNPGQTLNIDIPIGIDLVKVRAGLGNDKMGDYEFFKNVNPQTFLPRPVNALEAAETLAKYPFLIESGTSWRIPRGQWRIDDYIRTPESWQLLIDAGAQLEFTPNAGLMVFGQLHVTGIETDPVSFKPTDTKLGWSGITVFAEDKIQPSTITHAISAGAASPKLGLWQPRGATYFVKALVKVDHFTVKNNHSEDAFNAINSILDISNLTITEALSDAFDCDFCTGEIKDSHFNDIGYRSGGDGIDVSGSQIYISNVTFKGIRDKAISGGERSRLDVKNATFEEVNFGIVAKDDTTITAQGVHARLVKHNALMSYSKKPIFGGARMWIDDFDCLDQNCEQKFVAETGSVLQVNKQTVEAKPLNVKSLYNSIMKSDKPK